MQHPLHTPVAVQDIVPPQRLQAKQGWPLEMGGGGSCLTRPAGGHIIWRSKGLSVKYFTAHHPPSCPHRTHRSRNRPDWRSPWCRAPFSPSLSSEVQQSLTRETVIRRAKAKALMWASVEGVNHHLQLARRDSRKVLPEQTVRVLIKPPLARTAWVCKKLFGSKPLLHILVVKELIPIVYREGTDE